MVFPLLDLQPGDASVIINEKGCVQAGEEWLEQNLVLVAGVLVGIAFMQVVHHHFLSGGGGAIYLPISLSLLYFLSSSLHTEGSGWVRDTPDPR